MTKSYKSTLKAINEVGELFIPNSISAEGADQEQATVAVLEKLQEEMEKPEQERAAKYGLNESGEPTITFLYRIGKGPISPLDHDHFKRVHKRNVPLDGFELKKGVHYDVFVEKTGE